MLRDLLKHKIFNSAPVICTNMVNYDKPLGISLMAYFLFLLAIIIITMAVYVFLFNDGFWQHGLLQFLKSEVHRLIMVIVFGVLFIISGIGLLKSSPGGRGLLVALCALVGIHGLIMTFSDFFRGILVLLICGIVAIYMFTSRVSAEFQSIDSRKAVEAIDTLESYRKSKFF